MKVARLPLDGQVYDLLQRRIVTGELPGGARLVQNELASEFGVSRIPVRDALRRLETDGLVERDEKGNCRVISLSRDDVTEIYDIRLRLEGLAIRSAAARMTDATLAELREISDAMAKAAEAGQLAAYAELNRDFHSVIYQAAARPRLLKMIDTLWSGLPPLTPIGVAGQISRSLEQHGEILAALAKRDPDAAERAMTTHIESAGELLRARLARAAEAPGDGHPAPMHRFHRTAR